LSDRRQAPRTVWSAVPQRFRRWLYKAEKVKIAPVIEIAKFRFKVSSLSGFTALHDVAWPFRFCSRLLFPQATGS